MIGSDLVAEITYGFPVVPRTQEAIHTQELRNNNAKKILHGGSITNVVLEPETIRVGCTRITIEAAKYLLAEWEKEFGNTKTRIKLQ